MKLKRAYLLLPLLALHLAFLPAPVRAAETAGDDSDPPQPTTPIRGRVVDPEGNPVAGATVLAVTREAKPVRKPRNLFSMGGGGGKFTVAEGITDPEGAFLLEVEGSAPFTVRARADGYSPQQVSGIMEGDSPVLRLAPGWTVWGQVLDKNTGAPVAGAEVRARAAFTDGFADEEHRDLFVKKMVTGEDGSYEFTDLETNFYRVRAVADGYSEDVVSNLGVGLDSSAPEPVYLYLVPGITIAGTVTGDEGAPLEKAWVTVRPEQTIPGQMQRWARSSGFSERTDKEGNFEIRGIPTTSSYVVEAGHEDYAPTAVTGIRVREGGRSRPLEVALTPGTTLMARLLDGDKPFTGRVGVSLAYRVPGSRFTPRVGRGGDQVELEEGALTVRRLPTGKARVVIEAAGFADVVREGISLKAGDPADLGEIALESGPRIAGVVLGPEGDPVADAQIELMSFGTGTLTREVTRSDEDGVFRLGGLPEIAFTVSAEAEGYGRESVKEVKPDGERVEIRLRKAGRIRGRVLEGDPAVPVAGFTVESEGKEAEDLPFQLRMVGLFQSSTSFREPTGEFVMEGLAEGAYSLKIVAAGFVDSRLDKVEVAAGETTEVGDIFLDRGATLFGTLREAGSGKPVGGATVKIEPPGMFNMQAFTQMGSASRTTGPDGEFSLSGLPPGRHTIRVDHERYSTKKQEVEIAAGVPPADLTVELGAGGAIEGTFRDKNGDPVSGGMIMAMLGFAPDPNTMGATDEYGHFRIDHLAPGTYRVMALVDPGGGNEDPQAVLASLQMQTTEVVDGKTSVVNIPPQTGAITVNGTLRKGVERLEARLIWVRMADDGQTPEDFAMTVSDGNGAYQIQLTSPGEYRISVQPIGGQEDMSNPGITLKAEVPADEQQVTLDLAIPEIVLAGTVLDSSTGERLEKVSVAALEYVEDRELRDSVLGSAARTDAEGAYLLEGLAAGEYRLIFSRDGYGAIALEPMELEEDSEEEGLDAALEPAKPVDVAVTDLDGNPVEEAFVTCMDFPPLVIEGTTGQTDMNGRAVLTGLVEGTYDIGIIAAGYAPVVSGDVMVPTEGGEPVKIRVERGEPLTVVVMDGEDRPVANASVRIREEDGPDLTSMVLFSAMFEGRGLLTGGDGTLKFPYLAPGTYEIEVHREDRIVKEKVRIRAGKENRVEISL